MLSAASCRPLLGLQIPLVSSRSLAVTGRHSKKVAQTKNRLDAAKNKLNTRLGVKILMAAKAGGADPASNPDLARALKEAQSVKLPKENIDRALKKATDTSVEDYSSGIYEVFGFGGVGLVVTSLTDSPNRAVKEIKALARKSDAKIASSGSVLFKFEQKAVFLCEQDFDRDTVLEQALSVDMSDIQFAPNTLSKSDTAAPDMMVASVEELGLLQDVAAQLSLPGSSSLAYIPSELIKVSDEDLQRNLELVESFEDLDDVDAVFHNMDLD